MNIAIIDDDALVRQELEHALINYLADQYPSLLPAMSFCPFAIAEDFLRKFRAGKRFAIIFMDIYMGKMTGIDAAKQIRYAGDNTPIIFLTTSTEYQLEGYTVFAAGYIMKPLCENRQLFQKVLDHCIPNLLAQMQQLTIIVEHMPIQVPLHTILYLDCNSTRTVLLHLTDHIVHTSCTYQECRARLLIDQRFAECYHRIIINMDSISHVENETFFLKDGEHVPISRRKKNEVTKKYMRYLLTKSVSF